MEIILLIGIPAAGKSTFYETYFKNTHMRLSLDEVKTRKREKALLDGYLAAKLHLVIDNTNVTASDRARYIRPAKAAGYRIKGFFFEPDINGCLLRNSTREDTFRVPSAAIFASRNRLEPPSMDEGFDELYRVIVTRSGDFAVNSLG